MQITALNPNSPATTAWSRTMLRWMPTFLGFPAAGLATKLIIGRVDHVAAAIIGGALSGAILGFAQTLLLCRTGVARRQWIAATAAGFAIGLAVGASTVGYATNIGSLAAQGAITGLAIGLAQAVVLRRHLGRIVAVWPAWLAGLWALGWTITSTAGIDVDKQYSVFGSSGAIVVTALSAALPIALARSSRSVGLR